MKTYAALATVAALWATTGLAHAATLASSFLVTPGGAIPAACYIRNVGTSPVSLQVTIFNSSGPIMPTTQNCNDAPLPLGATCVVLGDAGSLFGTGVACSAKAGGSVRNLRGTLNIIGDLTPLRSAPLR